MQNANKVVEKKEIQEGKTFPSIPVLLSYNIGNGKMKKETLKVLKDLVELSDFFKLTPYTYKEVQGVAGTFLGDGVNTVYSVYELLLKFLNYFPSKTDILRLEEKIDNVKFQPNPEASLDYIDSLKEKIKTLEDEKSILKNLLDK